MSEFNSKELISRWKIEPGQTLGLIFDVDELLCRNGREIYAAYKMLLENRSISVEDDEQFPGKDLFEIIGNIKIKYNLKASLDDLVLERRGHYIKIISDNEVEFCEGVVELFQLIEQLKQSGLLRVAYTSSSEHAFIKILLSKLFDYCNLTDYVSDPDSFFYKNNGEIASSCWEPGLNKKPAPDLYLKTLGRIGLDIKQCIAIEDSLSGFQSARGCDLRVIVVPSESQETNFKASDWNDVEDGHVKVKSLNNVYHFLNSLFEATIESTG